MSEGKKVVVLVVYRGFCETLHSAHWKKSLFKISSHNSIRGRADFWLKLKHLFILKLGKCNAYVIIFGRSICIKKCGSLDQFLYKKCFEFEAHPLALFLYYFAYNLPKNSEWTRQNICGLATGFHDRLRRRCLKLLRILLTTRLLGNKVWLFIVSFFSFFSFNEKAGNWILNTM